jgi:hypothetical protein
MGYKRSKGDVEWYSIDNKKKRPIAYSTVGAKHIIGLLAEEYETITDVFNAIYYDEEAKNIMQLYINLGYGNEIARKYFKY